jgi:hypothetical protein
MTQIETISIAPISFKVESSHDLPHVSPGLRVMARTTSASLSDYPEWSKDERFNTRKDNLVSDGVAS